MKAILTLTLMLAAVTAATPATKRPPAATTARADSLFAAGEFDAADALYRSVLAAAPADTHALLRHGGIALLSNRLADARAALTQVLARDTSNIRARSLLAESWYRADEFEKAVPLLRALHRDPAAAKLESFAGTTPNAIEGDTATLPFVQTDPLPLIQVRVNGSEPVYFLIDTGGGETLIDSTFAQKIGAEQFGSQMGTFAGDQKGSLAHGRIDSLRLGSIVMRRLPVRIRDTRRFAMVAGGRQVDGILGTVALYHFLATLDYSHGALVLRRRGGQPTAIAPGAIEVPFWLAGDHLMVARGALGSAPSMMWFVDTGLAGAAFTAPESTLAAAGIRPQGQGGEGVGGGGRVKVMPFPIDRLSLGDARAAGLMGFLGPFPASLEWSEGFRIGGLISHGFFRGYALTFDFDRMRLVLVPRS
jgi:hypothetical protein